MLNKIKQKFDNLFPVGEKKVIIYDTILLPNGKRRKQKWNKILKRLGCLKSLFMVQVRLV
jgi:hypothetical protein